MFGDLKSGPRWNYEVPHTLGSNSTLKASNSNRPQNILAPRSKNAKFRCLLIWNRDPGGIMRSPTRWGSNSTLKASNSKHPQKNLVPRAKTAKFRCWWFEIGAPVELWGPPTRWGSNSTLKASNSKHSPKKFALYNKTINFKCLVIWNWVLTSSASCCNLRAKQLDLQKGSKKNHVIWNYNIHVTYNLCFCKHQVPCEEYKLEMFALNNLIFTSHNFWEPYPRWEKKKRERNESLWALYTSWYATLTYVACYVMWHEPHNMFQNKIWGGKIATLNMKSATPLGGGLPTPRTSAGLVVVGQGMPARAQRRAVALPWAAATDSQLLPKEGGPRVPAGTPLGYPWLPRGNQPLREPGSLVCFFFFF
jgi:hypothetical protein